MSQKQKQWYFLFIYFFIQLTFVFKKETPKKKKNEKKMVLKTKKMTTQINQPLYCFSSVFLSLITPWLCWLSLAHTVLNHHVIFALEEYIIQVDSNKSISNRSVYYRGLQFRVIFCWVFTRVV